MAEAVDVSEPSVYSYYHGFTTPRLDVLVAIAKVFDV
ncbi:MAG: helix-turn-helix domain-containing protein [Christensenellales bacterium]